VDVLGISALYHDAAAALVRDGRIVAAAQQERFSRRKHDPSFPIDAIRYCLEEAEVGPDDLTLVAYYDKPISTFVRILKSYVAAGPRGLRTFPTAMTEWSRRKLWVGYEIDRALRTLGATRSPELVYAEHHVSHAAAAFFPSPFEEAAVLTLDGVGEWTTASLGVGRGGDVRLLREIRFPDSIGLLYSAFTHHCGFKVNSGEYKLMGLAPFGEPRYVDAILDGPLELADDGAFRLDLSYFDFLAGARMTNRRFAERFGGPARAPEAPITARECDLARSIQVVVEEVVLRMARTARDLTGCRDVVLAGGVALNCVANGRLAREGPFDRIWVQPAAGDAGSAAGAALWATHVVRGRPRRPNPADGMSGTYLGPSYDPEAIAHRLQAEGRPHERLPDPDERACRIAELLDGGAVVGVFQGRMEFGPRALGHRSILADPRDPDMQRRLNLKVKRRESFRPFAPSVLAERAADWFELAEPSPYMAVVAPVHADVRGEPITRHGDDDDLVSVLNRSTSAIPAVTHVDGSARLQTVDAARAPAFHRILTAFERRTGCPVLVNTSFNVRGEPIVCTPEDAYRCFMSTDIDWLVLEDCLLERSAQPPWTGPELHAVLD